MQIILIVGRPGSIVNHADVSGGLPKLVGNVRRKRGKQVSPEEIIDKYGADTARLFILFAAPPEAVITLKG